MFSRVVRATLLITGVALAGFHGYVFAAQAAAGRLEDPWLMLRWLAAATLVIALAALRRSGDSILGRKAIAIWVLAGLLHGPTVAGRFDADFTSLALPETVTSVLQLVSSSVLAIGLLLLASLLAARRRQSLSGYQSLPPFSAAGSVAAGGSPPFSPRPPPLR
jgi:hypothetical protein